VLDDSLVMEIFVLRVLEEGRIEDFFFDASVDHEGAADLAGKLLLTHLTPGLFEGGEPALDLSMICLEQADRVTARSRGTLTGRFASGHGAFLIWSEPSTRRDVMQFRTFFKRACASVVAHPDPRAMDAERVANTA
jgi:hypothetical protein